MTDLHSTVLEMLRLKFPRSTILACLSQVLHSDAETFLSEVEDETIRAALARVSVSRYGNERSS